MWFKSEQVFNPGKMSINIIEMPTTSNSVMLVMFGRWMITMLYAKS